MLQTIVFPASAFWKTSYWNRRSFSITLTSALGRAPVLTRIFKMINWSKPCSQRKGSTVGADALGSFHPHLSTFRAVSAAARGCERSNVETEAARASAGGRWKAAQQPSFNSLGTDSKTDETAPHPRAFLSFLFHWSIMWFTPFNVCSFVESTRCRAVT